MTKKEAVEKLKGFDHGFISPKVANEIADAFGVKVEMQKVQDTRSQFKGLYVPSVNEGDWVEGIDADVLAKDICRKLGIEYREMFGRGSQLYACITALEEYITSK